MFGRSDLRPNSEFQLRADGWDSLWTLATALGAALGVFLGNRLSGKSKPSQSVA